MFIVFCLADLAQEIRNPKHTDVHNPRGSQILINVFDWSSLRNDTFDSHFNLSKAILRLYKDGNFTKGCSNVTLQAKVYCEHATGASEFTGMAYNIEMANGKYWEELDLTQQFKSLWPIPYRGDQVYVTVTLKSQCANNNLPIKLYDLKAISKLKLRRRLYDNQPVLCLYLKDDMTEKLARNAAAGHVQPIPSDEVLSVPENGIRTKRSTSTKCRKVDHIVSFKELGLSYVILPTEYNAGKCVGGCNYGYINGLAARESYKVNNYAKLLAAQAHEDQPETGMCCNPGEYDPLMLLISTADGSSVKQKLYHEMKVRECYCR